jgi:hypothetical protein
MACGEPKHSIQTVLFPNWGGGRGWGRGTLGQQDDDMSFENQMFFTAVKLTGIDRLRTAADS